MEEEDGKDGQHFIGAYNISDVMETIYRLSIPRLQRR